MDMPIGMQHSQHFFALTIGQAIADGLLQVDPATCSLHNRQGHTLVGSHVSKVTLLVILYG